MKPAWALIATKVMVPTLFRERGGKAIFDLLTLYTRAPFYVLNWLRSGSTEAISREIKKNFFMITLLLEILQKRIPSDRAIAVCQKILRDSARDILHHEFGGKNLTWNQYMHKVRKPTDKIMSKVVWDAFRDDEAQLAFELTSCPYMKVLREAGAGVLTSALCRADEQAFNDILPDVRFSRGSSPDNTIARGAVGCVFQFDNLTASENASNPVQAWTPTGKTDNKRTT